MTKTKAAAAVATAEEIERFINESGSDHVPTFGGDYEGGIQCQQIADEIAPCIELILSSGRRIRNYLEIGSAGGGTCYLFDHYFRPETIVLIDDNRHPKSPARPYILRDVVRQEIIGDSHAQGTVGVIAGMGISFDLMMIDGDHSYDGTRQDVDNYLPFLAEGGFLILHDTALAGFGAMKVKEELQAGDEVNFIHEWVSSKHTRVCGVSLFRKAAANEG